MNTIAIVLLKDMSVPYTYQSTAPRQKDFGGEWGNPQHSVHVIVPNGLRKDMLKGTEVDGVYTITEDQEKVTQLTDKEWTKLRVERNRRLSATDWTMLSDAPISSDIKASYTLYRQALRDIPQNTSDPFNPDWPTQP